MARCRDGWFWCLLAACMSVLIIVLFVALVGWELIRHLVLSAFAIITFLCLLAGVMCAIIVKHKDWEINHYFQKWLEKAKQFPIADLENSTSNDNNVVESSATATLLSSTTSTMANETATKKLPPAQRIEDNTIISMFSELLLSTWQYQNRVGKDAVGLKHTTIKIKDIFKLNNANCVELFCSEKNKLKEIVTNCPQTALRTIYDFVSGQPRPLLTEGLKQIAELHNGPLDPSVNEVYLFHGTKKEYVTTIAGEGLKVSAGGLYGGSAVYLAESLEKADQYADYRDDRHKHDLAVLVVRVLLGDCYIEKPGERINCQPNKPGSCENVHCPCDDKYDSVVAGHGKRFREFLVYNPHRCLPEFLIVYDRMKATAV